MCFPVEYLSEACCAPGTGISAVRVGQPGGTDSISQFPRDQYFQTGEEVPYEIFWENSVRFLGPILDFLKTKFLIRKTGEEAPYEFFWENSVRFQVPYKSS